MRQNQFAQIAHVRLAPIGFALITVTVTEEKGFEPMAATALIIDCVGARAAEVANGFIGGFGDIDGGEFASAQKSGDGASITLVGFERSTRLPGDEGRGGDQAGDVQLFEATSNDKATRPGFISDFELRLWMSFADAGKGFFETIDIIGDRAEEAKFAFGARFSDGDDDRVFVDV
jgi:hypothetical protein